MPQRSRKRFVRWGDYEIDVDALVARDGKIDPRLAPALIRVAYRAIRCWGDIRDIRFQHLQIQLERVCEAITDDWTRPFPPVKSSRRRRRKAAISRSLAKSVMERDAYRCVECRTHLDLTIDHIIPEAKGGPTAEENLRTLCRSCNSRKGTKIEANEETPTGG